MKPTAILYLALVVCVSTAASETVEQTAPLKPGNRVEIHNHSGSIEIEGWNRDRVEVSAELSSDASELKFVASDNKVLIKVVNRGRKRYGGTDLQIMVPKETHIEVTGVSSDIDVEAVSGRQRLSSVSGDINTYAFDDEVFANTVSGDIEIEGSGEETVIDVTTVSGEASVEDVSGEVSVSTTSGDLEVSGNEIQRLNLSAVSGDIDMEGSLHEKAKVDVETVNGDVQLDISGNIEAEFDLESFNGSISSIDGHKAKRHSKYGPGRYLEYTRGDGKARIRVNTLNGDIDIY
ncbi:MAG: DUF4097 family beta strand repeat-containing protein [Pseudomonadota bacterium]